MLSRREFFLIFFLCLVFLQPEAQTVDFTVPSTICAGSSFNIINNTTGASTYRWNFCSKDLNQSAAVQNVGGFGMIDQPTYIDIVFSNNNYYGFVTNFSSGDLIRLDFGSSLKNNPTAVNLGNIHGVIPAGGNGGIQVIQNEGKWYAIIVAGYPPGGINPRILKIEFGPNITNPDPAAVDWGNPGNMYDPNDLILVEESGEWIGITVNGETNSITRFNFGNSFDNSPVGNNLGNIGNLGEPAGLYLTHDNGDVILFITNSGDKTRIGGRYTITRLNFGNSLNNNPVAENIGNVGNQLQHPRDMVLASFCNETLGYILNAHPFYNSVLKIDFNNDISNSIPTSTELNHQAFDYPHAVTDFFNEGDDLVAFVVNRGNNTIARIIFGDCNNASLPNSTEQNPPAISYNQAGIYNIQLTVNEGTSTEKSSCKQVVVTSCVDTLITTNDTTICAGDSMQIRTHPAISYQWTPSAFLDDSKSGSPVTTTKYSMKYYVNALFSGTNLVMNGDFSNGNNNFVSAYNYTPTNTNESEYFVGNDPKTWNISLDYCSDHTNSNGKMLLVNGSPTSGTEVWSQTVTIKTNTDYAFSAWVQAIWAPNPANLQLFVNGIPIGAPFTAGLPPCNWSQFYSVWNSGANTSATLSIVDLNTSIAGNDFAIDDISFSELIPVTDSISITVKQPYIKANEDTTICAGSRVQLYVEQGAFFTWSPSTGLTQTQVPNPIATPSSTTPYTVVGIDPSGCLARDTVLITVIPSPVVNATADTTICKGETVQLTASGGEIYEWTPATALNNSQISNPVSSSTINIAYRVKVTGANACTTEDTVNIHVRNYPNFAASPSQTICYGESTTISASGGDKYVWSPSATLPDPTSATITFNPQTDGIYSVDIADNVCHHDTTINVSIVVKPLPVIAASKSNDINCTQPVAKLRATGGSSYTWLPAESLDNASIGDPVAHPDTTTTYIVSGTNEFGCTSSASLIVNVQKTGVPVFVVPNAFTPNNDGKNDCFGIQHWGHADIKEFLIYNRWGKVIFQTSDPSHCWDGTWKGQPQDGGGYIYIIRANTLCGEVIRKGMFTLIR